MDHPNIDALADGVQNVSGEIRKFNNTYSATPTQRDKSQPYQSPKSNSSTRTTNAQPL